MELEDRVWLRKKSPCPPTEYPPSPPAVGASCPPGAWLMAELGKVTLEINFDIA
jgi:hypothetical protein